MKKQKNDTLMWVAGGAIGIGAILALTSGSGNKKIGDDTFSGLPEPTPTTPPKPSTSTTLNRDKVLKKGVTGEEVKELQRLLGFVEEREVDGIFGNDTHNALVKRKGVTEVTLRQFATLPDINNNPIPIGSRVMAGPTGAKLYGSRQLADGRYTATDEVEKELIYGEHVGTVKAYNTTKTWYSVYYETFWGKEVGFVQANQVIKY